MHSRSESPYAANYSDYEAGTEQTIRLWRVLRVWRTVAEFVGIVDTTSGDAAGLDVDPERGPGPGLVQISESPGYENVYGCRAKVGFCNVRVPQCNSLVNAWDSSDNRNNEITSLQRRMQIQTTYADHQAIVNTHYPKPVPATSSTAKIVLTVSSAKQTMVFLRTLLAGCTPLNGIDLPTINNYARQS